MKNCINCGAPINKDLSKCPYCGTSYIDICGLEIGGAPIILKFRHDKHVYTMKAYVNSVSATTNHIVDPVRENGAFCCDISPGWDIDISFVTLGDIISTEEQ